MTIAVGSTLVAVACGSTPSDTGPGTPDGSTGNGADSSGASSGAGAEDGSRSSTGSSGGTASGSQPSSGSSGSVTPGGSGAGSEGGLASSSGASSGSSGSADAASSATGPCDLFKAGGTPCVAAFSTIRALSGSYTGNLYQVRRADGVTHDIGVLTQGGVADAAAQDTFCAGTTCTISILYDQSGKGNHLTKAPGGSATYGPNADVEAVADALPTTIGGHKAYGVHVTPSASWTASGQTGYRNTKTNGTATGDDPETEYMVTDGTYFNGSCCFDFGNAEMQAVAGGPGTMEAIYFGNCNWWDKGNGSGPWVMADLEVGVFNQGGNSGATNSSDTSLAFPFAMAMVKGNSAQGQGGGPFTIKGGNAQSGALKTMYDGARPNSYSPMHKQGGIVLGVGGDNSSTARGNFYEGVMTVGYASSGTDDAVQANIVAAGYGR
jgi:hypothetical protein